MWDGFVLFMGEEIVNVGGVSHVGGNSQCGRD